MLRLLEDFEYGLMIVLIISGRDYKSVMPYRWTQKNDFFLWSDASSLAMGGGGKGFSFVLTDDFYNGATNRSDTFENQAFVSSNVFKIDNIEVWGFSKYFDVRGEPRGGTKRR